MSHEALSPQQFFHGTRFTFRIGRHIDPSKNPLYPGTTQDFNVTDNPDVAGDYAEEAEGPSPRSHAKVYQVEPTGPIERDRDASGYGAWTTQHKVRVVKRVT